jgi:hypothetical protein
MRKRRKAPFELSKELWSLQVAGAELEALAHLFRLKRRDDAPPLDMDRINWGMSLLFEGIAKKVRRSARRIEESR